MIRRTLEASLLNEVANHPDVRPWLGGEGYIDLTETLANPLNVALVGTAGGFVLVKRDAGIYEAHSLFLPGSSEAIEVMREGLRYLFVATDCVEVQTKCPEGNKAALGLARAGGFREQFKRADASYQALTLDRWRATDAELPRYGAWFHEKLEAAKDAAGSPLPTHEDDEAHDRAVGAAVLMFRANNAVKAVWAYNKWAQFAGYAQIVLLSQHPVLVDVMDAVIAVKGSEMDILLCR